MKLRRKPNKIPFLILGLIHIFMLGYTFYKSNNRKRDIVLLFNFTGFAYCLDYLVVTLFKGYVYKPKFSNQKEIDNIAGSIMSQFFYVPITALFITVFGFGWKAKLLFSSYFVLIERIFTKLAVYQNKWWKTTYTFSFIFLSFLLNDYWSRKLTKGNETILNISFYNMIQMTWMNIIFVLALLGEIRYGAKNLSWKQHFKVAPFIGYFVSALTFWTFKSNRMLSKAKLFFSFLIVDFILIKKGVLKVRSWFVLPLIYLVVIISSSYYRNWVISIPNDVKNDYAID
ncbi:hypothetical protein [Halalkalibacter krulwichiae]|uniref:Uncharacterized protein n=1 Tax=Halalkalibacter krulwichiae TaxID=199441 RepID=A0A1X9MBV4_9BACI|nr:hypothetical protein [Halalkalibacter krulwichiae]ARK29633.1 hypothetical protein BkAM31D_07020 [Halalkalibacter krulwichiae]